MVDSVYHRPEEDESDSRSGQRHVAIMEKKAEFGPESRLLLTMSFVATESSFRPSNRPHARQLLSGIHLSLFEYSISRYNGRHEFSERANNILPMLDEFISGYRMPFFLLTT